MSADANSLKAGATKSNSNVIKSQATKKVLQSKMTGGPTKMGGALANKKQTNKSRMKTSTSEDNNLVVKFNDQIVTPKQQPHYTQNRLITTKFKEQNAIYVSTVQDAQEKKKNQKSSMIGKGSSSIVDSSVRSHLQSADKSSSSDVKMSSSNVQGEKSSFLDSKLSDDTYSDSDSRRDQSEALEKKAKKHKGLTEDDLEENIAVNLGETTTMTLLFIPSSIIQQEFGQSQGIIALNKDYDKLLIAKIGSDNYTDRPAQTFNFQPKQKDQQSLRIEKNDAGAFAAVWDLYDVHTQLQFNEYETLQDDIKKNIDKEVHEKLKNPFFMLPTDVKAISIHSRKEVPGSSQFLAEKMQGAVKSRPGQQQKAQAQSSLSGGQTNFQQSSAQQADKDDTIKNSSSSQTNTRIAPQQTQFATVTRTHGRTNQQVQQQQLLLQQQQQQLLIEEEEEVYLKDTVEKAQNIPTDQQQKVLSSESLQTSLSYVERILNQNLYHKQYIQYRNYPEVKFEKMTSEDDNNKRGPNFRRERQAVQKIEEEQDEVMDKKTESPLSYLFKYSCDLTQDRTVSSADWNPINQDLLAVSYGENELNSSTKRDGYIMFWTLKNPTYPERIIRYPSRITCCKFSDTNPNLIAAGTYDGVVAIWDIRRKDDTPVTQNKEIPGKHNDAVWEVQWVGKGSKGGSDKGETLVSISSDSRIVEWSMKKGLEYTDLMNLKRQSHPSQKDSMQEGVNFRWAAGFSFDFLKGESSMYLASTEEGTIHRCSKSYAEQYLDSYFGHSGPVYKVRCNPFFSDVFLTCSADWSCKLWNWREEIAIANFQSLDLYDEVLDMEWSPHCSTLFASVCKDGRLEMWDLQKNNMLDPFATVRAPEGQTWAAKTMVRFGKSSPVVITGDTAGDVQVYRLNGYEDCEPKNQYDKLVKLLYPTGYTKGGKEKHDQ